MHSVRETVSFDDVLYTMQVFTQFFNRQ